MKYKIAFQCPKNASNLLITNNYNRFAAFQANLNPMYSKLCCKTECRDKLLLTKS